MSSFYQIFCISYGKGIFFFVPLQPGGYFFSFYWLIYCRSSTMVSFRMVGISVDVYAVMVGALGVILYVFQHSEFIVRKNFKVLRFSPRKA